MCGIVGYTGFQDAQKVLLNNLEKLEYRGYDSAGLGCIQNNELIINKEAGKIKALKEKLSENPFNSVTIGIGHTRWATHGIPSQLNAHPHGSKQVMLVHNGIIENHLLLRQQLLSQGYEFKSETDSEVLIYLLENQLERGKSIPESLQALVKTIEGAYALAILFLQDPETIYVLRKDSPLVIGQGSHENFVASDMSAILEYTRDIIFLEENEIGCVSRDETKILATDTLQEKDYKVSQIDWEESLVHKEGHPHFMIKEILEQPRIFKRAIMNRVHDQRVDFSEDNITVKDLEKFERFHIIGCGTAYHAGIVLSHHLRELAQMESTVSIASEFRYQVPLFRENDCVVLFSQSGETADTLEALRLAKRHGIKTIALVNRRGSAMAREADHVLLLRAELEIAVASTKAYLAMITVGFLLAVKMAEIRGYSHDALLSEFVQLSSVLEKTFDYEDKIKEVANRVFEKQHLFFLGRGLDVLSAMEGSLKLKEISYIHSEAYPAGELKHGSLALIEEGTPVVVLNSQRHLAAKTESNAMEVKARGGFVLMVSDLEDDLSFADEILLLPSCGDTLSIFPITIVLQLFAYHVALLKGHDVDQPRHLAKSVTVE